MPCLFENRYFGKNAMLSEYVHKVLCRNIKRFGLLFSLLALLMIVVSMQSNSIIFITLFSVCFAIIFLTATLAPFLLVRQMKDAEWKLYRGEPQETIVQFGEAIFIRESTFSLNLEYDQIISIHELKHSYVLMFNKTNGILLDPAGFSVGTFEDFKIFIQDCTDKNTKR